MQRHLLPMGLRVGWSRMVHRSQSEVSTRQTERDLTSESGTTHSQNGVLQLPGSLYRRFWPSAAATWLGTGLLGEGSSSGHPGNEGGRQRG